MTAARAIDQIIAVIAALACLSLVVGLSDVELAGPPRLVAVPPPALATALRDAGLAVTVTEECAADAVPCPPLEGARVTVFWLDAGRYYEVGAAATSATGGAHFTELPRGIAWVLAESAGRARRSVRLRLGGGDQAAALALPRAGSLGVTVNDEQGAALVRATVLVEGDDPLPHGALTDLAGRAAFDRLDPAPWVVKVSAPGYETVTRQGVRADLTVTLRHLGGLAVKVVDEAQRPVPDATVFIVGSRLWPARRAPTDAGGLARVAGLLAGTYDLKATAGTDVSDTLYGLALEEGANEEVTLVLRAGRMVSVLVTDGSDERAPVVPGADVVLVEGGLSPFPLQGRTGADGTVTLGPIGSEAASVAAGATGFVPRAAVPVPDPLAGPVRIALMRGAKLAGEVVDTQGRPVDGASVEIVGTDLYGLPVSETPSLMNFRSVHFEYALAGPAPLIPAGELGVMPGPVPPIPQSTDATAFGPRSSPEDVLPRAAVAPWVTDWSGTFTAHPVTPGRVRAIVRHPEFVEGASEAVMLPPGGSARVRIVLHVGGALEGRVVDARGFAVEGVRVDVAAVRGTLERSTLTDRHGEFAFAALPGDVRLSLARPDDLDRIVLMRALAIVPEKTTEIELELPEPREPVEVVVVDEADHPVPAAQVTLLSLEPTVPLRRTYFTDEAGRATFEDARGLSLRVVVEAPTLTRTEQELAAAPERIQVTLERGSIVTGRITAVRGRTFVEGATVTLVAGGQRRVAFTNREGEYRFEEIPAGEVHLLVSHADHAPAEVTVTVASTGRFDRPFVVDPIDLATPGTIEGTVVDAEGHPVMGARVAVGMAPAYLPVGSLPEGMTVTDLQGRFRLTGVAPGTVTVEAYAAEAGRGSVSGVRVDEGRDTTGLEIALDRAAGDDEPPSAGNLAVTLGERNSDPVDIIVLHVAAGSEAERGGLVAGDFIMSIDGVEPTSMLDARARLGGSAGSDVVVEIDRDGEVRSLRIVRERVRR